MRLGTIFVTGASGLLGANLVSNFSARGERVVAQYRKHSVHFLDVESVQCDISDFHRLNVLLGRIQPAWIVHCAAITNVDWCERNPSDCYQINADATRDIAIISRSLNARMVYISTDAVFDGSTGNYEESDLPNPVNVYGSSKLKGETLSSMELPSTLVFRTNIFGWNAQDKLGLAEWILDRLSRSEDVPGFDDVVFSPLLANDVADLLLKMMARNLTGIYHAGASDAVTKYQFARSLAYRFGYPDHRIYPTTITAAGMEAPRPLNTSLRPRKLEAAIGLEMPTIQSGLLQLRALSDRGFRSALKNACAEEVN